MILNKNKVEVIIEKPHCNGAFMSLDSTFTYNETLGKKGFLCP